MVVLGLLALFLGSRGLQVAGFVVVLLVAMLADRRSHVDRHRPHGLAVDAVDETAEPSGQAVEPDYIPEAGTPSEQDVV